jgi:RND family efflux transporter MFP subunit
MIVANGYKLETPKESEINHGTNSLPPPRLRGVLVALAVALLVGGLAFRGLRARAQAEDAARAETNQLAVPIVSIIHPQLESGQPEIVLPANVQAFTNAPIYARTNGYLKKWYVDIGARVSKGELLAEIETPEVDQQLQQARGNLATAQANLHLAEITAKRYSGLLQSDSVSQQATDTAVGAFQAGRATVEADQANVRALEALQSFQRIYAPFDGVITVRNTDVGQLIDAGSGGGPATQLFDIAAVGTLRVYVNVPQIYSGVVRRRLSAYLTLPQFPNQRFRGNLVRTANSIDPASRTLLVEVDVHNRKGLLLPGAYAEAHFKLPPGGHTYVLPVTALIFRSQGLQVGVIGKDHKTVLKNIKAGRDFGTTIEVVSGVSPDDSVILNPPDSLVSGEVVRPVTPTTAGGQS